MVIVSTMFKISLSDQDRNFTCNQGESILRSGLRAGFGLPYECNTGSCGTCKFSLLSGEVKSLWSDAPGLTDRDRKKGRRLACQSIPITDCTIKIRQADTYVPIIQPRLQNVILSEISQLTHDMSEFYFTGEGPAEFAPGQYALFKLPGVTGLRAYSMSNISNKLGNWKFCIKNVPGGSASTVLFGENFKIGYKLSIDAPFGMGYLRNSPRDIVCIAGGSGLSPMISVARGMGADPYFKSHALYFFYGGRRPQDIHGERELSVLDGFGDRIYYHSSVSETVEVGREWKGHLGNIHELVPETLPKCLSEYEFYFAGPPTMVDATQRMLMIDHKIPFEQLHFDKFF